VKPLLLLIAPACLLACMSNPSPLSPSFRGSVGIPHNGVLTDALELPEKGRGFRRFRPRASSYFGLPRLVRAIERSAATVDRERPGGAPLVVGDLSVQSGGKIPRHNSHRSGRDVDFLFYLTTPQGVPLENPGFFTLESDGFVEFPDQRYARLDIEREWLFMKALLEDPEIDVQFLFISEGLEALLIDYALAREVDLGLVWHAQTVMLQPGDSLPHGDHVHMRVACRPDEAVEGCSGGGPHWPWLSPLPYLNEPLATLFRDIHDEDPFELAPLPLDAFVGWSEADAQASVISAPLQPPALAPARTEVEPSHGD